MVPAPSLGFLVLSAAVPEFAVQFALAIGLLLAVVCWGLRGRARAVVAGTCAVALGLALLPLAELPATIAASDAALSAATGRSASANEAGAAVPFDLAHDVMGVPAPGPLPVRYDLPVVTRDGAHLALDLYRSAARGPRPAVVLLYGGAWQFGRRSDMAPLARRLASLGYTAIAVDYRHAPAYRFPTQLDDVRAALSTIARNAAAWGVDRDRVATLGESAGAELALLAAYSAEPLHIRATVGFYAPLDFVRGYERPPSPDPANVRALLTAYLGGPPSRLAPAYAAASPIARVRPGLPATLLLGGVRDELCEIGFQRDMRARLGAAGDRVAALEFPWSNHGFAALPNTLGGQLAYYYAEHFLAETIDP